MTAIPGYTTAVNEVITQAQTWMGQASAAVKASAAKVEAGTYTVSDATADMVQAFTLTASGWIGLAAALFEAATDLGPPVSTATTVESDQVDLPTPVASPSTLAVAGPISSLKGDVIPASKITFKPSSLAVGDTSFVAVVAAAGLPSGAYDGPVSITPASGAVQTVTIYVWL
jgi:hypothetical protein